LSFKELSEKELLMAVERALEERDEVSGRIINYTLDVVNVETAAIVTTFFVAENLFKSRLHSCLHSDRTSE